MQTDGTRPALMRLWPIGLLVLAAAIVLWFFGDRLTYAALQEGHDQLIAFRDANYWTAAAVFVVVYASIIALSLPGSTISTLTGGFLFTIWPGTLLNMTGATLGAIVVFLVVRFGLGRGLAARVDASGGRMARIKHGLDRNQWSMLFFIRFVPIIPFFAGNLLSALLNVPLHRFVISTFLGIIPGALVYTSVGAGLGRVLDTGGRPDLGVIFEPHILLPLLGLAGLSLLPVFFRGKEPE